MKQRWWLGSIVVFLLLLPLWPFLARKGFSPAEPQPSPQQGQGVPVRLIQPEVRTLERTLEVTGTLKAENEVRIGSKIPGRVAQVLVDEGQLVQAGQPLVLLDTKDLLAQVRQAEAGLEMARARFQQALRTVGLTETQTDTQVKQAEEALKAAKARLAQALESTGLTSAQTATGVQQAEEALKAAQARYEQALEALRLTKEQVEVQIQQAQAGVEMARSRLAQAEAAAKVTPGQIEQQVAQARAALETAKQRLAMLLSGARPEERKQAEAALASARANFENAQAHYERMSRLFQEGAIPKAQLDGAKAQYEAARSQLEMAQQQVRLVNLGAREEERRMAELQVQQAEAALQLALTQQVQAEMRQRDVEAARAALRQAEEALALAQAQRTQVTLREKEVETARTQVEQAKAALELAKAGEAQNRIREQDVEAARTAVRQAEEALRLAQANRVQTAMREDDIAALRAQVRQAEAMLQLARNSLADATIRAPVPGAIALRLVEPGEMVAPGVPLLTLVNDRLIFFEAIIPETQVAALRTGLPARVRVDALGNEVFQGTVAEVLPAGDASSRNFMAKIALPNPQRRLKTGMFARGEIVLETRSDALMVPQEALVREGGQTFLFVVQDHRAHRLPVETGWQQEGWVEIRSGLTPGERIILEGVHQVREGMPVRVVD